jgi:hypothetical protein
VQHSVGSRDVVVYELVAGSRRIDKSAATDRQRSGHGLPVPVAPCSAFPYKPRHPYEIA